MGTLAAKGLVVMSMKKTAANPEGLRLRIMQMALTLFSISASKR